MSVDHLHVPVPGELLSPASGSALVTVAEALGAAKRAAGGSAGAIVRRGMAHRPRHLELVEAALPGKVWLTAGEKAVDLTAGAVTGGAPRTERLWAPVYAAVPATHTGPVFLYNAPAAASGLARRRPSAQPVVYLQNEVTRGWPPWRRRRLVRDHRVVCNSRFVADRLLPRAADRGDVLALVNGVDTAQFSPAPRPPEPTVLFVGKVTAHKGADLLVEAARLLFEQGLRFRLRIVGGAVLSAGGALTAFEQQLRRRGAPLGAHVSFEPFVARDAVADAYRDATVMVVPSNWDEPCSLTLPEGMASGLACVAARRGGLPEVGGDAPLYFDPPDVGALAACLRRLLVDDGERAERAALARRRAEQISWERQLAVLDEWLR